MGCSMQSDKPFNKYSQRNIIEFILSHGAVDLNDLAELVNENVMKLSLVLSGKHYLKESSAKKLCDWFMVMVNP